MPEDTYTHTITEYRPFTCLEKYGIRVNGHPNPLVVICPDCKAAIL